MVIALSLSTNESATELSPNSPRPTPSSKFPQLMVDTWSLAFRCHRCLPELVANWSLKSDPKVDAGSRADFSWFPVTWTGCEAASTYYSQAKAKYAKCKDFTESVPASSIPGSGKMETTLLTMSKTKVGKYQAFELTQAVTLSELPGFSLTLNTLVTVEGTDVFTVVSLSGTNDPVSASLMLKFVNRVKKLR